MVVDDPAEALEIAAAGTDVVLVLAPSAPHVPLVAAGPGRVAVFSGTPGDPAVAEAAAEMDRELFGQRS